MVLVNTKWDAQEREDWQRKVDEEAEKEALCLDLEKLTITSSSVPEPPQNLSVSQLKNLSLDLTNLLIDEGKRLQLLHKDLS